MDKLQIGGAAITGPTANPIGGELFDYRHYFQSDPDQEITDYSGNENHGIRGSSLLDSTNDFDWVTGGAFFDGVDDEQQNGVTIFDTHDWSIFAVFASREVPSGNRGMFIWEKGVDPSFFELSSHPSHNPLRLNIVIRNDDFTFPINNFQATPETFTHSEHFILHPRTLLFNFDELPTPRVSMSIDGVYDRTYNTSRPALPFTPSVDSFLGSATPFANFNLEMLLHMFCAWRTDYYGTEAAILHSFAQDELLSYGVWLDGHLNFKLFAYYKCNEIDDGDLVDELTGQNLTHDNNPEDATGLIGGGRDLDQGNKLFQDDHIAWTFFGDPFTVNIWTYVTATPGGNHVIISVWDESGSERSWRIYRVGNKWRMGISTDGSVNNVTTIAAGVKINEWQMITLRHDGTTAKFDIHSPSKIASVTSTVGAPFETSASKLRLNDNYDPISEDGLYLIDELAFWNRHLSDGELDTLYNSGSGFELEDIV